VTRCRDGGPTAVVVGELTRRIASGFPRAPLGRRSEGSRRRVGRGAGAAVRDRARPRRLRPSAL